MQHITRGAGSRFRGTGSIFGGGGDRGGGRGWDGLGNVAEKVEHVLEGGGVILFALSANLLEGEFK